MTEPMKRWTSLELARPDGRIITARECWLSVVGCEAEDFRCRSCGKPPLDVGGYPPGYCRQPIDDKRTRCGCPQPQRCVSCDAIVEPTQHDRSWDRPQPFCEGCENENRRKALGETIRRVIPHQLRLAAKEFYHKAQHRAELVSALRQWVETHRLGKREGPSCVLAWGSRGSGKSVAAAWAVGRALSSRIVTSAYYVTEDDLTRAAVAQFSDDKREAQDARSALASCQSTSLLVLDELGSNRSLGYSPRETKEMLRVLHHRLSERKPTILVSNLPPTYVEQEQRQSHLGWLDERIDSRFEGCGWSIECTGPDMRACSRVMSSLSFFSIFRRSVSER